MAKLKEKITLKQHRGGIYEVLTLENRMEPSVGSIIVARNVEDLMLEAKVHGVLTVKVV
jgi:hypothetical protein